MKEILDNHARIDFEYHPQDVKKIKFTFSESKYSGPLVLGWPQGKNRRILDYIPDTDMKSFKIKPSRLKPGPTVLITVHVTPAAEETRRMIRNTWGHKGLYKSGECSVRTIFVVGSPKRRNKKDAMSRIEEVNEMLKAEAESFGDILQANFVEHYNNLTLKSLFSLKYALSLPEEERPIFTFKVDSDVYINVPKLCEYLENYISILNQNHSPILIGFSLSGHAYKNHSPMRLPPKVLANRKRKFIAPKWFSPPYLFNGETYPPVMSGSGYIMNFPSVRCIYEGTTRKYPFFHLEDVLLTGFGAQECKNLTRIHAPNYFNPNPLNLEEISAEDLLLHYVDDQAKLNLHKLFSFDSLLDDIRRQTKSDSKVFMEDFPAFEMDELVEKKDKRMNW